MSLVSDEVNKVVNDFFKDKVSVLKPRVDPATIDCQADESDSDLQDLKVVKRSPRVPSDPRLRTQTDNFYRQPES